MKKFTFADTEINDLKVVTRKPIFDNRGYFERFYCMDDLSNILSGPIKQINVSQSVAKGTVRGLHYQTQPYAEFKYVSCLRGSIYDVAVDLRADSPTYLNWYGVVLSDDNRKSLAIPEGFAHGFQTLEDETCVQYLVNNFYNPSAERVINPSDPLIKILWPLPITCISDRDRTAPFISKACGQ